VAVQSCALVANVVGSRAIPHRSHRSDNARFAAIVLSGGCGPHGNSWVGIRSSWNHVDLDHATYLSKWPFDYFRESAMKLPHRRNFLHLAAGAAALPVMSQIATAQTYIRIV
jgi:hypothetical protein